MPHFGCGWNVACLNTPFAWWVVVNYPFDTSRYFMFVLTEVKVGCKTTLYFQYFKELLLV